MTINEERRIRTALTAYVGPVNDMFWTYLELCIGRLLADSERRRIGELYLGWR